MQHMLSVTGNICAEKLPAVNGVEIEHADGGVQFTAASAEDMQRLKRSLALSLANTIIEEYEGQFLAEFINTKYKHLDTYEKQEVLRVATSEMENTSPKRRAHYIENRLYTFLSASDVLSVDGFVAFRLKEYRALLKRAASHAATWYETRKEYEEFIALLQYFISLQPVGTPLLHVLFGEDNTCRLYSADGEEITFEDADAAAEMSLTVEETLLSALISIAPQEVILHHAAGHVRWEIMETVYRLFPKHVHLCENCQICAFEREK